MISLIAVIVSIADHIPHGCIGLACSPDDVHFHKPRHCLEIGALCSPPILRPDKALESRIFCNNKRLVAALQVAPKDVAKGGSGRREAFCKGVVTGAKKAEESLGQAGTMEMRTEIDCPDHRTIKNGPW